MAVSESEIIIRLLLSAGLGLLIGFEREINRKPAGLRTHALVALGSCLFTLAGTTLIDVQDAAARIIPGIITGIGFIGAGLIFQSKDKGVIGLTTAAEIWTLASVGVLAGLGEYIIAISATILILVILVPIKWFEKKMEK